MCLSSDSEKEDDGIPEEDMEMLESRDRKGEDEIKGDRIHLVAGVEDNKWGREKLPRCLVCRMSDSYEMWAPAEVAAAAAAGSWLQKQSWAHPGVPE